MTGLPRPSAQWHAAAQFALLVACAGVGAQESPKSTLPSVTVIARSRDPVEKSYRKMIQGMDYFERKHAMAPNATLRFKLLPRRHETNMNDVEVEISARSFDIPVPVAPDQTFTLVRNQKALDEDAVVSPNRKKQSMTWRTEIRTPGLPPNTRRLGDMRLECQVGIEADLVSNSNTLGGRIANLFSDPVGYCDRKEAKYLFFAERPLFSVALVAGRRREFLPIDRLYAEASDDPGLKYDLPYCDCEVMVARTYYLPLGDHSWPDDTRVEFEYMDD
ncbi:MAG: hypothetical protein JWQ07_4257 [Ramlibacter sp.]|nr:hypothetical protein [Ramlibacter sp.]